MRTFKIICSILAVSAFLAACSKTTTMPQPQQPPVVKHHHYYGGKLGNGSPDSYK